MLKEAKAQCLSLIFRSVEYATERNKWEMVGKPGATAPAPLTVVVQQLSGRDLLVEKLAKPHIDRAKYISLSADDGFEDGIHELIAGELRALEAQKSNTPETGVNADGTRHPTESRRHLERVSSPIDYGKIRWVGRGAGTAGITARR